MQRGETAPSALRTRVYVDGYNFYYGCLKGTCYKWLDLYQLFSQQVIPSVLVHRAGVPCRCELLPEAIQYFTARIIETAAKAADSVSSQARYHSALRKLHDGRIRILEGYYSLTKVRMPRIDEACPGRWPRDCDRVAVWKLEEKQSDVSLALHAYHDAVSNHIDQAIVVSNDTDLMPALRMIRAHTEVIVGLVIPTLDRQRSPNADLAAHCHWVRRHLTVEELAASQLPRVVHGGKRPTIKPDSWHAHPELFREALQLAAAVRGSRSAAFQWFDAPSPHFGGQTPISVMTTEAGLRRVIAYMRRWTADRTRC